MKLVDGGRIHVYRHDDGKFTVAEDGVWLSGVFDSEADAIAAANEEADRAGEVIAALKPCKLCNGSGAESNMWRDKKNGCGRCNGYGWVLTGNRDNFRAFIAAAKKERGGDEC